MTVQLTEKLTKNQSQSTQVIFKYKFLYSFLYEHNSSITLISVTFYRKIMRSFINGFPPRKLLLNDLTTFLDLPILLAVERLVEGRLLLEVWLRLIYMPRQSNFCNLCNNTKKEIPPLQTLYLPLPTISPLFSPNAQ